MLTTVKRALSVLDMLNQSVAWTSAKALLCLLLMVSANGCATQQQMLDQRQAGATQTALERAKFEMNCPSANATVLSQDFIQPAVQGPWVSGLQRVEYTIGVEGCNQREVYVVLCQEGTNTCFSANPNRRYQLQQ